jgi:hypothetical protein
MEGPVVLHGPSLKSLCFQLVETACRDYLPGSSTSLQVPVPSGPGAQLPLKSAFVVTPLFELQSWTLL